MTDRFGHVERHLAIAHVMVGLVDTGVTHGFGAQGGGLVVIGAPRASPSQASDEPGGAWCVRLEVMAPAVSRIAVVSSARLRLGTRRILACCSGEVGWQGPEECDAEVVGCAVLGDGVFGGVGIHGPVGGAIAGPRECFEKTLLSTSCRIHQAPTHGRTNPWGGVAPRGVLASLAKWTARLGSPGGKPKLASACAQGSPVGPWRRWSEQRPSGMSWRSSTTPTFPRLVSSRAAVAILAQAIRAPSYEVPSAAGAQMAERSPMTPPVEQMLVARSPDGLLANMCARRVSLPLPFAAGLMARADMGMP